MRGEHRRIGRILPGLGALLALLTLLALHPLTGDPAPVASTTTSLAGGVAHAPFLPLLHCALCLAAGQARSLIGSAPVSRPTSGASAACELLEAPPPVPPASPRLVSDAPRAPPRHV